jgi:hypothetical protein
MPHPSRRIQPLILFLDDVLKIVFTNLDPKDPEREFSMVIDLSRPDYRGKVSFSHRDIVGIWCPWTTPLEHIKSLRLLQNCVTRKRRGSGNTEACLT